MHAIMKFCMRRRDRYECYVPHPLPLDGKSRMLCSRENKKAEFTKSASTMICKILPYSHLKSIGILTAFVFFSYWFIKLTGRYKGDTETHYVLKVLLFFFCLGRKLRRIAQSCGCLY